MYALVSLAKLIWTIKGVIILIIDMVYFARMVVISFMVVYSGWYEGRSVLSPTIDSYHTAIYLLMFEFVFVNVFYYIIVKSKDINFKNDNLQLKFRKNEVKDKVYIAFIILNVIFIFLNKQNISILGIGQSNGEELVLDENMFTTFMSISLYVAKYILIGFTIQYFYNSYKFNNSYIYICFSVLIILLINTVFIGQNRMDALLPIITSLLLLNYLYRKKMLIFNGLIVVFSIASIYFISILRNTFAYNITENKLSLTTDYLQVYLGGIYNIALSLEIDNLNSNNDFLVFFYDLIRPFLGLNLLWRSDTMQMSSTIFNFRIFGTEGHVTQIIPLIGQFYLPFGVFGVIIAPLIISTLLRLFLKHLKESYIIDSVIIIPIVIRLCFTFFQNVSIFINELSSLIIIYILLRCMSYILNKNVNKFTERG